MITLVEKTYRVQDENFKRTFIKGEKGISVPGLHSKYLRFEKSKPDAVVSFYKALGEFIREENLDKSEQEDLYQHIVDIAS